MSQTLTLTPKPTHAHLMIICAADGGDHAATGAALGQQGGSEAVGRHCNVAQGLHLEINHRVPAVSVITLTLSLMYPEADSSHPIFDVMVLLPLLLTIIALGMFAQVHSTLGAVFGGYDNGQWGACPILVLISAAVMLAVWLNMKRIQLC